MAEPRGWFAIKRGITEHPVFEGRPERLAIWLWLLDHAAWRDSAHDIGGRTVIVPRGSVAVSERRLAKEVGVGYQVVRTFLARLKTEHMINAGVTHGRNVITLLNYDKYQSPPTVPNASPNAAQTHGQRTKEQGNNYSDTSVSDAEAPPDPTKIVFERGLALLEKAGIPEKRARPMLGRWRSIHGDAAVITALGRAQREGAIDPAAFIEGCLRRSVGNGPRQTEDGRVIYADAFGGGPVHR